MEMVAHREMSIVRLQGAAALWLRYELFRGRLTDTAFQASEANLIEFIKARGDTKPHLAVLM
jgi:hypothetical protein